MNFKKVLISIISFILGGVLLVLFIPSLNSKVYHLLIDSILDESVPYIYNNEIDIENDVILDTRTLEEFNISHIPNAIWVGEDNSNTPEIDSNARIVLYCSIGKRSEVQGEILKEKGIQNVYNLYGGIFEWHNGGMTIIDSSKKVTLEIHPYSWFWGLWVQ